tara:strand:+ start:428 stop:715 length:288 start_codon:yes stop_codon:yes gene_type:complete
MAKLKQKKHTGAAVDVKGGRMAMIISNLERDLDAIEHAASVAEGINRSVLGVSPPEADTAEEDAADAMSLVSDLQDRMQYQIGRLHQALQHLSEL